MRCSRSSRWLPERPGRPGVARLFSAHFCRDVVNGLVPCPCGADASAGSMCCLPLAAEPDPGEADLEAAEAVLEADGEAGLEAAAAELKAAGEAGLDVFPGTMAAGILAYCWSLRDHPYTTCCSLGLDAASLSSSGHMKGQAGPITSCTSIQAVIWQSILAYGSHLYAQA